ncbi:hypothetical protein AAHH78_37850, partial [Burkholderia pseudomallei]
VQAFQKLKIIKAEIQNQKHTKLPIPTKIIKPDKPDYENTIENSNAQIYIIKTNKQTKPNTSKKLA